MSGGEVSGPAGFRAGVGRGPAGPDPCRVEGPLMEGAAPVMEGSKPRGPLRVGLQSGPELGGVGHLPQTHGAALRVHPQVTARSLDVLARAEIASAKVGAGAEPESLGRALGKIDPVDGPVEGIAHLEGRIGFPGKKGDRHGFFNRPAPTLGPGLGIRCRAVGAETTRAGTFVGHRPDILPPYFGSPPEPAVGPPRLSGRSRVGADGIVPRAVSPARTICPGTAAPAATGARTAPQPLGHLPARDPVSHRSLRPPGPPAHWRGRHAGALGGWGAPRESLRRSMNSP